MASTLKLKKWLRIIFISKIVLGTVIISVSFIALYFRTWYLSMIAPALFLIYCILLGMGSKSKIVRGLESLAKLPATNLSHDIDAAFFESNPKTSFFAIVRTFWPVVLCIVSCANCMIFIEDLHLLERFDNFLPHSHPYWALVIKMATSGILMILLSRGTYLTTRKIRRALDSNPFQTVAARS